MFDVNTVSKRYYQVEIGNINLEVEPPKLKVLKKITNVVKAENQIEELINAVVLALNKNKTNYKVDADFVEENLNIDEMTLLLSDYFDWVAEANKNPN